jgi:hypothetical protein
MCGSSLFGCSSDNPVTPPAFEAVSPDPTAQKSLEDVLPRLDEVATVTLTNVSIPPTANRKLYSESTLELQEKDWPEFFALLKDSRPIVLRLTIMAIGHARIVDRQGKTFKIRMYYSDLTGLVYWLENPADSNSGQYYIAPKDNGKKMLSLLPT